MLKYNIMMMYEVEVKLHMLFTLALDISLTFLRNLGIITSHN
jgi:hypothetical protein